MAHTSHSLATDRLPFPSDHEPRERERSPSLHKLVEIGARERERERERGRAVQLCAPRAPRKVCARARRRLRERRRRRPRARLRGMGWSRRRSSDGEGRPTVAASRRHVRGVAVCAAATGRGLGFSWRLGCNGTTPGPKSLLLYYTHKNAHAVPLASARQRPENQKENQAGHSSSCSAHRAEYPRIREFACSRACIARPPTCTHVAWGLVLVLCEGSTKRIIKTS